MNGRRQRPLEDASTRTDAPLRRLIVSGLGFELLSSFAS
jgi:hypothetical protein